VAKGGRIIGARRSSSRERRVFVEGCAVSFVLRRGRDARRVCRWKAPWVGKAHAFHEAPAEPILAASEQASGIRRKANSGARHGGGDRGVRGGRSSISHGGRKRLRVSIVRSPKWESRREARFSPASFRIGRPRANRCLPRAPSGVRGRARQETVA